MTGFQVQPHKQWPTQFKQLQRDMTQLRHLVSNINQGISWTLPATGYLNGWGPVAAGSDFLYEVTPDGNFVVMSGRLLIPSVSSGSVITTINQECWPVRQECILGSSESGTGAITPVMIQVDNATGNVAAFGTLAAGNTLSFNGAIPLAAVAS